MSGETRVSAPIADAIASFLDTPEAWEVMRMLCFQLSPIAHVLRLCGHNIACKAEDEQAYVMRCLLKFAIGFGPDWRKAACDALREMKQQSSTAL